MWPQKVEISMAVNGLQIRRERSPFLSSIKAFTMAGASIREYADRLGVLACIREQHEKTVILFTLVWSHLLWLVSYTLPICIAIQCDSILSGYILLS